MTTKMEPFEKQQETWSAYYGRFKLFCLYNKIEEERQPAGLLTAIGVAHYRILQSLAAPVDVATLKLNEINDYFAAHYDPKPSILPAVVRFQRRNQGQGESINDYINDLRRLASWCEYKEQLQRQKLLAEGDLTLDKAVEMARVMESANSDVQEIHAAPHSDVNYVAGKRGGRQPTTRGGHNGGRPACMRCGGAHASHECRFKTATCNSCKKLGHLAAVCLSKQQNSQQHNNLAARGFHRRPQRGRRTNAIVDDTASTSTTADNDVDILYTVNSTNTENLTKIQLNVDGRVITATADTGSPVTLFSLQTWRTVGSPPLSACTRTLRSATRHPFKLRGQCYVSTAYEGQTKTLQAIVVEEPQVDLVVIEWLRKLNVDMNSLFCNNIDDSPPKSLNDVLSQHKEIFRQQLGHCTKVKANIYVTENAPPKFCKPRPVPYAIKDAVANDLDRLERLGVIEKVSHADWAAPVVSVQKRNGQVRICGDYKVTVNQHIVVERYLLPRQDDLFAALAGGQKFTKLDLADAYLQIELDNDAKKLLNINTHKGAQRRTCFMAS